MSRTKDQWLEQTGGFRFGESSEQFIARTAEIERLKKLLSDNIATDQDVTNKLMALLDEGSSDE